MNEQAGDIEDSGWAGLFGRFGNLTLDLQRQAGRVAAGELREAVLDVVQPALGFDSAFWAAGAIIEQVPVVHTVYVYRQPPEMMQDWERIKQQDMALVAALANPGRAVLSTAEGVLGGPAFSPEAVAHCRRYGMEHIVGSVYLHPDINLIEGVAFYRADPGRPFTEMERVFVQALLPHMVEVWSANRLSMVLHERRQRRAQLDAMAICDRTGLLHTAGPDFAGLLQLEWPGWRGPRLPSALAANEVERLPLERIVVITTKLDDLLLVRVRRRAAVDQLSARELDVARRYAEGHGYQDIAAMLHIAPATVRNHLKNIYAKLGVGDKAALANLVRR
jgi:DNA-binding CsgD family transcriptional regulator